MQSFQKDEESGGLLATVALLTQYLQLLSSSASAGVFQSSVFHGVVLRLFAMAPISSMSQRDRPVSFGKYCLRSPPVYFVRAALPSALDAGVAGGSCVVGKFLLDVPDQRTA